MALRYVERFATTEARLAAYLDRKLRARGWRGDVPADPAALVARMAALGYVDDRGFAQQRAAGLTRRGYGVRRVGAALRAAGIAAEDAAPAEEAARDAAWAAALAFARRRRIGPFAPDGGAAEAIDPLEARRRRDRAMAAMLRAGHPPRLAARIVDAAPGAVLDEDQPL
nr:RecX family transcriptional regulator [Sphingomonas changnyeongensis]